MIHLRFPAPASRRGRPSSGRYGRVVAAAVGSSVTLVAVAILIGSAAGLVLLGMATALAAAYACFAVGHQVPVPRGWQTVGAGALVWAAGRAALLGWDDGGSGEVARQLLGHGASVAAMLLMAGGLVSLRPARRAERLRSQELFDLAIAVATLVTVLWALIGEPALAESAHPPTDRIAAILHLAAVGVLLLVVAGIVLRLGPAAKPALRSLALGLALVAAADVVWTMRWLAGDPGSVLAGAGAAAAWGVLAVCLSRDLRTPVVTGTGTAFGGVANDEWRLWLPYPLIAILLIVIGKDDLGGGLSPRQPVVTIGTLVVIAAVLLRQTMAVRQARRLTARLSEQVDRDPLTGLINQRKLHERLELELAHGRAMGQPVAVALIDVDDFKEVNDTHGHVAGNRVLQVVATLLASSCRTTDAAGRYAGDEFALILPDLDLADARAFGQRLLDQLAWLDVGIAGVETPISLSIGIAVSKSCLMPVERTIAIADAAMYEAKRAGKNRIVVVVAESFRPGAAATVRHRMVIGPGAAS